MIKYTLLGTSSTNENFAIVVEDNNSFTYHGISQKGIEWSTWARNNMPEFTIRGLDPSLCVIKSGYTSDDSSLSTLISQASMKGNHMSTKSENVETVRTGVASTTPAIRDFELSSFGPDHRDIALDFKAMAFISDSRASSTALLARLSTPSSSTVVPTATRSIYKDVMQVKAARPRLGARIGSGLRSPDPGMVFVDVTGTIDADVDGIVFEGTPMKRPIIPRMQIPRALASRMGNMNDRDAARREIASRRGGAPSMARRAGEQQGGMRSATFGTDSIAERINGRERYYQDLLDREIGRDDSDKIMFNGRDEINNMSPENAEKARRILDRFDAEAEASKVTENILNDRFSGTMTLDEAAKKYGMSREDIRRIETREMMYQRLANDDSWGTNRPQGMRSSTDGGDADVESLEDEARFERGREDRLSSRGKPRQSVAELRRQAEERQARRRRGITERDVVEAEAQGIDLEAELDEQADRSRDGMRSSTSRGVRSRTGYPRSSEPGVKDTDIAGDFTLAEVSMMSDGLNMVMRDTGDARSREALTALSEALQAANDANDIVLLDRDTFNAARDVVDEWVSNNLPGGDANDLLSAMSDMADADSRGLIFESFNLRESGTRLNLNTGEGLRSRTADGRSFFQVRRDEGKQGRTVVAASLLAESTGERGRQGKFKEWSARFVPAKDSSGIFYGSVEVSWGKQGGPKQSRVYPFKTINDFQGLIDGKQSRGYQLDRFESRDPEGLSRIGTGSKTRIETSGSNAVEDLTWDDRNRELIVTYKGGRTYTYKNVDDDIVSELESSDESLGRLINTMKQRGYEVEAGGTHADIESLDTPVQDRRRNAGMRSSTRKAEEALSAAFDFRAFEYDTVGSGDGLIFYPKDGMEDSPMARLLERFGGQHMQDGGYLFSFGELSDGSRIFTVGDNFGGDEAGNIVGDYQLEFRPSKLTPDELRDAIAIMGGEGATPADRSKIRNATRLAPSTPERAEARDRLERLMRREANSQMYVSTNNYGEPDFIDSNYQNDQTNTIFSVLDKYQPDAAVDIDGGGRIFNAEVDVDGWYITADTDMLTEDEMRDVLSILRNDENASEIDRISSLLDSANTRRGMRSRTDIAQVMFEDSDAFQEAFDEYASSPEGVEDAASDAGLMDDRLFRRTSFYQDALDKFDNDNSETINSVYYMSQDGQPLEGEQLREAMRIRQAAGVQTSRGMRSSTRRTEGLWNVDVSGSSAIRQATWDEDNDELIVTFPSGRTYTYSDFTGDDYDRLTNTGTIPLSGRAINELKKTKPVREGGEHLFDPKYQDISFPGGPTGRSRLSRVDAGDITQIPVGNSSAVSKLTYDDPAKELIVTFRGGDTYTYSDVEPYWIRELENDPDSVGRIINNMRREDYPGKNNPNVRLSNSLDHGPMPDEGLQAERARFGMRSATRWNDDRRRAAMDDMMGDELDLRAAEEDAVARRLRVSADDQRREVAGEMFALSSDFDDARRDWIADGGDEQVEDFADSAAYRDALDQFMGNFSDEIDAATFSRYAPNRGIRSATSGPSNRMRSAVTERGGARRGGSRRGKLDPGLTRMSEIDGSLWESLSPEDRETVRQRAQKLEKEVFNRVKKRFPNIWADTLEQAKDPKWRSREGWTDEDTIVPSLLFRLDAKLRDVLKNPDISDTTKKNALKDMDDLRTLYNMRSEDTYEFLEHLSPASRGRLFKDDVYGDGKTTAPQPRKTVARQSTFFSGDMGVGSAISSAKPADASSATERDKVGVNKPSVRQRTTAWAEKMRDSILSESARRRRLRAMREARKNGINAGSFSSDERSPLKPLERKARLAKRQLLMKKGAKRDVSELGSDATKNRVPARLITRGENDQVTISDGLAETLGSALDAKAKHDALKKSKKKAPDGGWRNEDMAYLWEGAGYNGTPMVITRQQYDALLEAGWKPLVRGHGQGEMGARYADDYIDDPVRFIPGQGGEAAGPGDYFALMPEGGVWYSRIDQDLPSATAALIPPDSRRVSQQELRKIARSHGEITKAIDVFDAGLPQGEREKMAGEEYVSQLTSHLQTSLGDNYSSIMGSEMGQVTAQLLNRLSSASPREKKNILDALKFLSGMSKNKHGNYYAPLLGYDLISVDERELVHNRTAIVVMGETLNRQEVIDLSNRIARRGRTS